MENRRIFIIISTLAIISKCWCIRVGPCATNKIAPYENPEGRTFGNLFGFHSNGGTPLGTNCNPPLNPNDDPALVNVDGNNGQGGDYLDPVTSEEDTGGNRPIAPQRPYRPRPNGLGNFWNWWPNFLTEDEWPTRPQRPPPSPTRPPSFFENGWFSGWFGNKPTRPPFRPDYDEDIKPVHEYIENEQENVSWRPGLVVGGPNNDIVAVTQDLSNWSTVPTPRPTRPYIPGQRGSNGSKKGSDTLIGSFIDLLFKR